MSRIFFKQMLLLATMLFATIGARAQDDTTSQTTEDREEQKSGAVVEFVRAGRPRILVEQCVGPINFTGNIRNTLASYGRAELVYEDNVKVGGTRIGENIRKEDKIVVRLDSVQLAGFDFVIGMSCSAATQTHTSSTIRNKNQTYTYHNYTASQNYALRLYNAQSKELVRKGDRAKTLVYSVAGDYRQRVSNSLINDFPRQLRRLINRTFPVSGKVKDVFERSKNVFTSLDLGVKDGVNVNDEFNIMIEKVKKGETVMERIGRGTVTAAGDDYASCKLKRGEKKVLKAFQNGTPLFYSDEAKPNLDEKDDKDDD